MTIPIWVYLAVWLIGSLAICMGFYAVVRSYEKDRHDYED
jgi:hypothetical protein